MGNAYNEDQWRDHPPATCKQCGEKIPRTERRVGAAFGERGRERELCSPRCRKRWSRAHPKR